MPYQFLSGGINEQSPLRTCPNAWLKSGTVPSVKNGFGNKAQEGQLSFGSSIFRQTKFPVWEVQ